jgi:hypothetical protein
MYERRNKMKKHNIISVIATVILASALVVGVSYAFKDSQKEPEVANNQEKGNSKDEIPADWKSYVDAEFGLTLSSPADFTFTKDENGNGFRIYKWGPSQAEGTEVYDGLIISFEKSSLNGQTLEEASQIETASWAPHGEIIEPLSSINVAGRNGYAYVGSGLGEFKIYLLPLNSQNYLRVSVLSEDPGNQGFKEQANKILDSLRFSN